MTRDEIISAFFQELDARIKGLRGTPADSSERLSKARPALKLMADNDPEAFAKNLAKLLPRLLPGWQPPVEPIRDPRDYFHEKRFGDLDWTSPEPQVVTQFTRADLDEYRSRLFRDPSRIAFVGDLTRIGYRAFLVFLEYRHFPPQTPRNVLYHFLQDRWHDLFIVTVSIPAADLCHAEALANQLGLSLKRFNRLYLMYNEGGKAVSDCYPIYGPGVFTVENTAGHFVYQNNFLTGDAARRAETEAIEKEISEYEKLHPPRPFRR